MQVNMLNLKKDFFKGILEEFEHWCNENDLKLEKKESSNEKAIYIIKTKLFAWTSFTLKLNFDFDSESEKLIISSQKLIVDGINDKRLFSETREKEASEYIFDFFDEYIKKIELVGETNNIDIKLKDKDEYFKNTHKISLGIIIAYLIIKILMAIN
jgi:hypothetical protein